MSWTPYHRWIPDVLSITPNAPFKDLKELIEAAKAKPGRFALAQGLQGRFTT